MIAQAYDTGIISFTPALPCSAMHSDGEGGLIRCKRAATAGSIEAHRDGFLLVPLCMECVREMARVYGITNRKGKEDKANDLS